MNDWRKIRAADAAKIMSGGAWIYRNGRLVKVSMAGLAAAMQELLPEVLAGLCEQLGIGAADIEDLNVSLTDDLAEFTVMLMTGVESASATVPLPWPGVQ